MIFRGKVIGGEIVLDGDVRLPEGAIVKVALHEEDFDIDPELRPHLRKSREEIAGGEVIDDHDLDGEGFELSPEDLAELEDRAAAAERGEVITSKELFERLVDAGDNLDDEERAALHRALEIGLEQAHRGEGRSAQEILRDLRSRR
jgi:hypothetical protein